MSIGTDEFENELIQDLLQPLHPNSLPVTLAVVAILQVVTAAVVEHRPVNWRLVMEVVGMRQAMVVAMEHLETVVVVAVVEHRSVSWNSVMVVEGGLSQVTVEHRVAVVVVAHRATNWRLVTAAVVVQREVN